MKKNHQLLINHLSNVNGWISADELASYIHISSRTIRNYIKDINKSHNNQPLILSSKNGYRINPKATSIGKFYKTEVALPETPNERHYYIIRKLLNQNGVSINELTDVLSISERTLEVDLLDISSYIKNYEVKIRRQKDNLKFEGDEINKRKLSAYCIKQTEEAKLSNFNFLKHTFQEFDVTTILTIVKKHIDLNGLNINGFLFYDLLMMLIIQIFRIQHGNIMKDDACYFENIQLFPDYQAAIDIANDLGERFNFHFTKGEVYFLCIAIISTTDYSDDSPLMITLTFQKTYTKFQAALKLAEHHFDCSFTYDEFLLKLTHHFQRIQIRSSFRLFPATPIFFDIRNKCPFLYEVATHIIDRVQENPQDTIHQDEIDFVAFHLGFYLKERSTIKSRVSGVLVCPSYFDITNTIVKELRVHTSAHLEITEIYDTLDIEKLADDLYLDKLIISVLPIENLPNAVTISPFLTANDFSILNNKILSLKRTMYLHELKRYLDKYLTKDFFEINHYFKNTKDAIHYLCKKLENNKYVDENYVFDVLKREKMSSTSFFNILALPHSCKLDAKKSALQIIINDRPMLWNDEYIKVIVMIVISDKDSYHFHIIYDLITKIFSDSKIVKQILMVKDLKSFIDIFQKFI
ncbi:BglG family transcription antiterminator [Abyssisolibacter fermentans]|uniref:BglG family transcription antiterminator n=1 Tax=Abyssisolibacter fermentans TaxID=1766203 RepID=UPI00082E6432|nr:PTS sugar transporter subunit IIA [Abyssisolibacter fermentans]